MKRRHNRVHEKGLHVLWGALWTKDSPGDDLALARRAGRSTEKQSTMENVYPREYLSFGDALFLHLEREGIPINIACVAILEGEIRYEEFLPFAESKLSQLPRCAQRVVTPPFNIGLPTLEYDPEFDFRNHVREATLKRGTDAELRTLVGKLFSENFDRKHPLWDFTLVHGLRGDRTALIARLHHSMADGLSGVAFLNALMDTSPEVPHVPRRKMSVPEQPPRDAATTLLEAVTSSWFLTVERLLSAHRDLVTMARRVVAKPGCKSEEGKPLRSGTAEHLPSMEELSELFPEIASSPERMPFNVVCRGPQRFEWTELPFEDLHDLKQAIGCTFNDVALAVVASTYRRYTEWRGTSTRGRSLRIVVPVNTRPPDDDSQGMGNQITFVPVSVPMGIRNARKLMAAVHERMTAIKQARIAEMVAFAGALIAAIPSPLQVFLAPIAAQLPLTVCNLIFTNVPGPKHPLYVLGHKMLSAYPYVPIGGEMGSNCAMLTYNGKAHFGFSCDVHATPDSKLLPQFLHESVEEFREAIGIAKPSSEKRRAPRRNKRAETERGKSNGELRQAAETVQIPLAEIVEGINEPEPAAVFTASA